MDKLWYEVGEALDFAASMVLLYFISLSMVGAIIYWLVT